MNTTKKPKGQKLSLDKALDKYYSEQVQKGKIEAMSANRIEITGKPFASYLQFLALCNHWGKILRKITGKTVFITASYYSYDKKELKHETKRYRSNTEFINSLR
jgi:hypothetical protein